MKYNKIFNKVTEIGELKLNLSNEDHPIWLMVESLKKRIWVVYEFGKYKISHMDMNESGVFGKGLTTEYFRTQDEVLNYLNNTFEKQLIIHI